MGVMWQFTGVVTEISSTTKIKDCRCAGITVESKHCQIIRDGGSSSPYFMETERKFYMPKEAVKAFRLGQKLTITLSSDE